MKIKKDIGVIIRFDDNDYSYKETILLYQQFFEILGEIANVEVPKNFAKSIYTREFHNKKDQSGLELVKI